MIKLSMQFSSASNRDADAPAVHRSIAARLEDLGFGGPREQATELNPEISLFSVPGAAEAPTTPAPETAVSITDVATVTAAILPAVVAAATTIAVAEQAQNVTAASATEVVSDAAAQPADTAAIPSIAVEPPKVETPPARTLIDTTVEAIAPARPKLEMKLDVLADLKEEAETRDVKTPHQRIREAQQQRHEEDKEITKGQSYAAICWSAVTGVQKSASASVVSTGATGTTSLKNAYSEAGWAIKSVQGAYNNEEMPDVVAAALNSIIAVRNTLARKLASAPSENVLRAQEAENAPAPQRGKAVFNAADLAAQGHRPEGSATGIGGNAANKSR